MRIDRLTDNLAEVYHRTRDIQFSDKSQHSIKMSKAITRYLKYIEVLYQIIDKNIDPARIDNKELKFVIHTLK
jgi:NTE family protein